MKRPGDLRVLMFQYGLTVKWVARYLGVSENLVHRWRMNPASPHSRAIMDDHWQRLRDRVKTMPRAVTGVSRGPSSNPRPQHSKH